MASIVDTAPLVLNIGVVLGAAILQQVYLSHHLRQDLLPTIISLHYLQTLELSYCSLKWELN
jgi:hypothetical protein